MSKQYNISTAFNINKVKHKKNSKIITFFYALYKHNILFVNHEKNVLFKMKYVWTQHKIIFVKKKNNFLHNNFFIWSLGVFYVWLSEKIINFLFMTFHRSMYRYCILFYFHESSFRILFIWFFFCLEPPLDFVDILLNLICFSKGFPENREHD